MPASLLACAGAGSGSGSAFLPSSIAGLQFWLQADVGVYQDAARTTPAVADGDPVGGWADQSGNARHVSQATAGLRPLLKLAEQNGLPSLLFDGSNDVLALAALAMADTGFSLFVVGKLVAVGSYPTWVSYGGAGGGWSLRCPAATGKPSLVATASNQGAGEFGPGTVVGTAAAMVGGGYQLLDGHVDGSDGWTIFQQGTLRDTRTVGITLPTPQVLSVGLRGDALLPLSGHEAEILLYNPVLSAGDATLVRAYLNTRWALY